MQFFKLIWKQLRNKPSSPNIPHPPPPSPQKNDKNNNNVWCNTTQMMYVLINSKWLLLKIFSIHLSHYKLPYEIVKDTSGMFVDFSKCIATVRVYKYMSFGSEHVVERTIVKTFSGHHGYTHCIAISIFNQVYKK